MSALADKVASYVAERQHVSFPELMRLVEDDINVRGDICMCSTRDENLILYTGMSEEFYGVVASLIDAGKIYRHPATMLTYLIDGGLLNLPLAKSTRMYKTPHWFPIVFCTFPFEPKGKGKRR